MMSPAEIPSKAYRNGSMTSKIKEDKESLLHYWPTKLIFRIEISPRIKAKKWQKITILSSKKSALKLVAISSNSSKKSQHSYLR